MNDFTKEELNFIYNYMFAGSYQVTQKEMTELKDKIQYMIDNYCEHENIREKRDDEYSSFFCRDCGVPLF